MPAPDTIVLIHGFWVTPRSWENWVAYYEAKGFKVIAPGLSRASRSRSRRSTPIPRRSRTSRSRDRRPPRVGRRRGREPADHRWVIRRAASSRSCCSTAATARRRVVLNSAPTEGVKVAPVSQLQLDVPGAQEPGNRHRRSASPSSSSTTRSPTASTRRSRGPLYERYAVPANGGILFDSVLANIKPGHQDTGSTTTTRSARRCCSSPAAPTTSCRRASSARTPSTTRARAPSPRSSSSRARTSCPRSRAGRRSPTTRSTGRSSTPAARRPCTCRSSRRPTASSCSTRIGAPARPWC